MVQVVKERMKEITEKQTAAIRQIIQNRDFNLSEYKKLKRILDARVITRQDASMFLEYCYAKVRFERYFNGHKHKSYAACHYCKSRDNLRKIENIKTGEKKWCCQTCRIDITDPDIIDLPTARCNLSGVQRRNELSKIKGLATDIVLMADDSSAGAVPHAITEMAEDIMETASGLLKGKDQGKAEKIPAVARVQPPIVTVAMPGE